jgi:hypothetical protein
MAVRSVRTLPSERSSGTHFCYRSRKPQGLVWPEEVGKLKKIINLLTSRTRDLPACSIIISRKGGFLNDTISRLTLFAKFSQCIWKLFARKFRRMSPSCLLVCFLSFGKQQQGYGTSSLCLYPSTRQLRAHVGFLGSCD